MPLQSIKADIDKNSLNEKHVVSGKRCFKRRQDGGRATVTFCAGRFSNRHSKSIKEGLAGFLADFQKAHSICTCLADLWIMEEVRYRSCNIFNNAKCSQTI